MEETNPYAPPGSDVDGLAPAAQLALDGASTSARFLNLLIDMVVRQVILLAINVSKALWFTGNGLRIVLSLGLIFAYYVVLEGATGRTIGKLVTGTRVVTADGGRPTWGQICVRTLARFIPFEPFSFLGRSGSGWHDTLSRTRVVRVRG